MKIKRIGEVLWNFYYKGRAKATDQTLRQLDINQMVMLAYGTILNTRYATSRQLDDFAQPDLSIITPLLTSQIFPLSEPNTIGMRSADMSKFDFYSLPKNGHFTKVFPMGGKCGSEEIGTLTQVAAGEEYFYTKPDFSDFQFYVIKGGRTIEAYHLPDCVDSISVESTFIIDDADVSMDVGYAIATQVLNILFGEMKYPVKVGDNNYDPNVLDIKHELAAEQNNNL